MPSDASNERTLIKNTGSSIQQVHWIFLGAICIAILAGCETTYKSATFKAHPDVYRSVGVVPISLDVNGGIDKSQSMEQLQVITKKLAEITVAEAGKVMAANGYQIVGSIQVLPSIRGRALRIEPKTERRDGETVKSGATGTNDKWEWITDEGEWDKLDGDVRAAL